MDTGRDLARNDPWRESLERSIARRDRPARPPAEPVPDRAQGDDARLRRWVTVTATFQVWSERVLALRSRMPTLGPRSVAAIALVSAIVASSLAGGGPQASPSAAQADAARAALVSQRSQPGAPGAATGATGTSACPLAIATAGYVNPLAGATVKPERIDQGVDYAGSGTLVAIGSARIIHLATTNTGWPGAFLEYQLLSGADAGCYVFYAEGVTPADGLTVGDTVAAGQPIATIIPKWPTGIEIGWASGRGTKAYAKVAGQWSTTNDEDNIATPAGKNFSALIAALGGPPGIVEG